MGDKNGVWVGPRLVLKQVGLTLLSGTFPNALCTIHIPV